MRTKLFVVLVFMLFASDSLAFDEWTKTDTALQGVYTLLHVMDWGQTAHNAKRGWGNTTATNSAGDVTVTSHAEANVLLGSRPSPSVVHVYFAGTLAAHTLVSYILPKPWRNIWHSAGIALEARVVYGNYNVSASGFF